MLMKQRKLLSPGIFRPLLASLIALLLVLSVQAQTQTVKGTVVDETGTPVAKATVRVKGERMATTSGEDGSYVLNNVKTGA
ncbi:MAG: hypothetical protein EOP48_23825, partial [Sphingobacteriales bacterium]